jgi:hypothetical protein
MRLVSFLRQKHSYKKNYVNPNLQTYYDNDGDGVVSPINQKDSRVQCQLERP